MASSVFRHNGVMKLAVKESRLGLMNSRTRLPFRYGKACLEVCPQAILEVTLESAHGRQQGYSGDCLPPGWFDKTPGKSYSEQIDDMLAVIGCAQRVYAEELATPTPFFSAWMIANERIQSRVAEWRLPQLLASFGNSVVERAILDAAARSCDVSFHKLITENILGIQPSEVHATLVGEPSDWLPAAPLSQVHVRHTVGLTDPLTEAQIIDQPNDDLPCTLEDHIQQSGLQYFKVKLRNSPSDDLERLIQIAALIEAKRSDDYHLTLDGNEQYGSADELIAFIEHVRDEPRLETLLRQTVAIEQPIERRAALNESQSRGIQELSQSIPVIIDESDGTADAYMRAKQIGYRGVSSKNCKGAIRSLLNAGLTWQANEYGTRSDYLMTGEDLCSVGVVPVQADLCLAATIGLTHVERNGHHYHPGLTYLPSAERQAALTAHGDFYEQRDGLVVPRIVDGRFDVRSLHCVGFGFDCLPNMDTRTDAAAWEFSSLGLA